MSKPAHKNIEHPPGQIVYKILHDHVNPDGTEMTPLNTICNECETVAHCSKNGCIPKIPNEVMISDLARGEYNRLGHIEYLKKYHKELYRQLKDAALLESDTSCFRNKGMKLRKEQ